MNKLAKKEHIGKESKISKDSSSTISSRRMRKNRRNKHTIVLAPDVAQAFPNEMAVNNALRLLLRIANEPLPQYIAELERGINTIKSDLTLADRKSDDDEEITKQLDTLYAVENSSPDPVLNALQRVIFTQEEW